MFFGWDNIKKMIMEWLATFSNENSWLSSKRIERFVFINFGVWLTTFVVIYNRDKFSASDNLLLITPLFVYAGFSLTKTEKEKLNDNQQKPI
jgi:hypothetical protein